MLRPIEQWKKARFEKRFGKLTSEELLSLAIEAEQIKKDCGPFDPAYMKFIQDQHDLTEYAILIEKERYA